MRRVVVTLLAITLAGIYTQAASARGEFRREVPKWWLSGAMCVHKYEGSWTDSGAPYYGGMQMDWSFMRHYGAWSLRHLGTAEHWPMKTQLLVAWRGWKRQGWWAWPTTARICGLI